MKWCKFCERNLDLESFYKKQSKCKKCQNQYLNEYYKKYPEKRLTTVRKWRKKMRIIKLQEKLRILIGK